MSASQAIEADISSIRKAAIERMQAKLGPTRGTIPFDAPIVMVTNRLLDQRRPLQREQRRRSEPAGYATVERVTRLLAIDEVGPLEEIKPRGVDRGLVLAAGATPEDGYPFEDAIDIETTGDAAMNYPSETDAPVAHDLDL
ncbi:MAG: hypothetical protein OXR62_06760 [Ahrensia sp.]|nr:hypothetical protein [Ahrensia sp.]